MFVRLTLEKVCEGLVATISEGDDGGKIIGTPRILLLRMKEEASGMTQSKGSI